MSGRCRSQLESGHVSPSSPNLIGHAGGIQFQSHFVAQPDVAAIGVAEPVFHCFLTPLKQALNFIEDPDRIRWVNAHAQKPGSARNSSGT